MLTEANIRQAFAHRIEPIQTTAGYRAAAMAVGLAVVLLPLLYLALVVGAAWGCWWYATVAMPAVISNVRNAKVLVLSATPLIAAIVVVIFLLKPLLARLPKDSDAQPLNREDAPLLFELVDRLCDMLGSPRPTRIDIDVRVNASASLRRGLFSVFGNDLVLTIGLPLVNGLTLRQFTGVLAHEFGHFSQGAGMRISYVIRLVNYWFQRVIYSRDSWDATLEGVSDNSSWIVSIPLGAAKLCVRFSRWVLLKLMLTGHAISSFLQRQMEFDADQAEIRTVGTRTFIETSRQLHVLDLADQWAHAFQKNSWKKGRLGDNLPALIQANLRQIPASDIEQAMDQAMTGAPGMYDSHPPTGQRIAKAEERPWEGVFTLDGDASALFRDFPAICRRASTHFYSRILEVPPSADQYVATDEVMSEGLEVQRYSGTLQRVFGGLFDAACWLRVPPLPAVAPAAEELARLFDESRTELDAARAHVQAAGEALDRMQTCHKIDALAEAGFQLESAQFGLASTDPQVLAAEIAEQQEKFEEAGRKTTEVCPALMAFVAGGIARRREAIPEAWLRLLQRLAEIEPLYNRLIFASQTIQLLESQEPDHVQGTLAKRGAELEQMVGAVIDAFHGLSMPWPEAGASTVAEFLESNNDAGMVIQRIADLYSGVAARLAEQLELAAGLARD